MYTVPTMDRRLEGKHAGSRSSTALAAVALQDHLTRSLSLNLAPKRLSVKKPTRPRDVKAVVDTGRGKVKPKPAELQETEYVLDAKPVKPTLAQKLGLVDAPHTQLTEDEWHKAKHQSNQRDDSAQPCVICKEDFGVREQVLLSCTHVFHRACLEAFERFTGRKTCPMCRREQYQKRVIYEGAKQHRQKCATIIQAHWRGYVVRCWYKKLRETVPPKDAKLRKKFYEEKLESITERMVRSCDYDINSFLSELDRNLEASRDVFKRFDTAQKQITDEEWEAIQLKAVERGNSDCPICLTNLEATGIPDETESTETPKAAKKSTQNKPSKGMLKSGQGHTAARSRSLKHTKGQGDKKSIDKNSSDGQEPVLSHRGATQGQTGVRESVLLSCSHVFHKTCLQAFEELTDGDRKFLCPVCRTAYQKRVL